MPPDPQADDVERWTIWVCPRCRRHTTDWKNGINCDCGADWREVEVVPATALAASEARAERAEERVKWGRLSTEELAARRPCLEGAKQTLDTVLRTLSQADNLESAKAYLAPQVTERIALVEEAIANTDAALKPVPPDPQADDVERWTISVCPEHGPKLGIFRRCPQIDKDGERCCERPIERIEVVPASQLAECRAERDELRRAEQAEQESERLRRGLVELVEAVTRWEGDSRWLTPKRATEIMRAAEKARALLSSDTEEGGE